MRYVFDLDGTLVDTREANRQAYLRAGIEPAHDFHQIPWQRWTVKEIHDQKNLYLPDEMKIYAQRLPLLDLALSLNALVLSNISSEALDALLEVVPERNRLLIKYEMPPNQKVRYLGQELGGEGVYFDDSLHTCQLIRSMTDSWQAVHVIGRGQ